MPLLAMDVGRDVFVGTLMARSWKTDKFWKAGRAAKSLAAEGVVKIDIPRPLLNDVDV